MNPDITLSQLISSRLCHDLVGAAGAINAGIELLGEDPSDIEAPLGLMANSAEQVTRRLSFFRFAFGGAGGPESPLAAGDVRKLIEEYLSDKKVTLKWNSLEFEGATPAQQSACGKLLSLLLLISSDCLPRGGQALIHVEAMDEGLGIAIEASGVDVRFPEDIKAALHAEEVSEQLSARNVHAFFANQLSKSVGGTLEIELGDGVVQMACMLPG